MAARAEMVVLEEVEQAADRLSVVTQAVAVVEQAVVVVQAVAVAA
jgi:hypothetical protein